MVTHSYFFGYSNFIDEKTTQSQNRLILRFFRSGEIFD